MHTRSYLAGYTASVVFFIRSRRQDGNKFPLICPRQSSWSFVRVVERRKDMESDPNPIKLRRRNDTYPNTANTNVHSIPTSFTDNTKLIHCILFKSSVGRRQRTLRANLYILDGRERINIDEFHLGDATSII